MTVRVLLQVTIDPDREAEFEALWDDQAAHVAGEPANLGQQLLRSGDGGYVVLTDWTDEPAFRAFEQTPWQQEYLRKLWPMRQGGSMTILHSIRTVA